MLDLAGPRGVRHGHVPPPARRRWRRSSELPESFRTGLGHDYDSHGPEGAVGIERSFEPWNRVHLLPTVLPTLDGVGGQAGGRARKVVDIGCGAGGAVLLLAEAFPASRVRRLRHLPARPGAGRRSGSPSRARPTPRSTTPRASRADGPLRRPRHDVRLHPRHDRPAGDDARRSARAIADDGTWLLVDIKALDTFAENVRQEPDGAADVRHQRAVVHVVGAVRSRAAPASGTLGLPPSKAEAMARDAGFTQVPQAARRPRRQRLLRDPP